MRTARVLLACALALASACGDSAAPQAPIGGDPSGDGDAAGDGDAQSTIGPVIEVISPKAADNPTGDEIVVGATVEITCKVTQRDGGAAVDTAKVIAEIYEDGKDAPVVTEVASSAGPDQFKAKVALAAVPGGKIKLGCSAPDLATRPQTGRALISTFYDSGPVIEFTTLQDGAIVPLGDDSSPDVSIQFSVKPLALVEGDKESAIDSVVLDIDGQEVKATLDDKTHTYVYKLDFQTLFGGVPVTGAGVTVSAKNKRSPTAAESSKRIGLMVDGNGPTISIKSPLGTNGLAPIVGARVDVTLEVTDPESGVSKDPGKLYATISYNSEENKYPLEAKGGNTYQFTFFAAQFEETANVTANIHVEDLAGNVSVLAHTMRFDTAAPWVTLEMPAMRAVHPNMDELECSGSFNYLGTSPVDGQIVPKETRIRAYILEQATEIPGATELWFAGVDDTSTKLLVMEGTGDPILVDKVGDDGVCDTVAAGREFALDPIKPAGSFPAFPENDESDPPADASCVAKGGAADPLCQKTSDLYLVPSQTIDKLPVVYGTKVSSGGLGCTGTSVDIQAQGGWVCLVAAAADNVGNVSFSAPIRVCRELTGTDCPGDVGSVVAPPAGIKCTDGCELPESITNVQIDPYIAY